MKKTSVIFVSLVIIVFLLAWTVFVNKKRNPEDQVLRQAVFIENLQTQESCETYGYTWKAVWKAQFYTCIEEYSDGGESCESSSDCQGNCIQKDIDGPATCELSSDSFGCGNTVENIAAGEGILCID